MRRTCVPRSTQGRWGTGSPSLSVVRGPRGSPIVLERSLARTPTPRLGRTVEPSSFPTTGVHRAQGLVGIHEGDHLRPAEPHVHPQTVSLLHHHRIPHVEHATSATSSWSPWPSPGVLGHSQEWLETHSLWRRRHPGCSPDFSLGRRHAPRHRRYPKLRQHRAWAYQADRISSEELQWGELDLTDGCRELCCSRRRWFSFSQVLNPRCCLQRILECNRTETPALAGSGGRLQHGPDPPIPPLVPARSSTAEAGRVLQRSLRAGRAGIPSDSSASLSLDDEPPIEGSQRELHHLPRSPLQAKRRTSSSGLSSPCGVAPRREPPGVRPRRRPEAA